MKVNDIIRHLETLAPPEYAMDWDNPGLLAGRRDRDVSCVYVALDRGPSLTSIASTVCAMPLWTR